MKENFVASYRAASTELARASIETRIRSTAPPTEKDKNEFVSKQLLPLVVPPTAIRRRYALILGAADVMPLWRRMDGEMTLFTAIGLYTQARERARERGMMLAEALSDVLFAYDALPVRRSAGIPGKYVRQAPPTMQAPRKPAPPAPPTTACEPPVLVRDLWGDLRSCIAPHLDQLLEDVDPSLRQSELDRLERELKATLAYYSSRWKKVVTEHADAPRAVERRRLAEACRKLRLDPPKKGQEVDEAFVKRAKTQYKRLFVLRHHPDRGGDPAALQDATNALSEIETYYEKRKK